MTKQKNTPKYKRENQILSEKKLNVMKNEEIRFRYDKGQIIITDKNDVPFDLGKQTMIRSYQGKNKKRIIAKATNLDFATDQVGSWAENFDRIFAIDSNTHPQKCNDYYCSVGFVYHGEVEKINEYQRSMTCKPYLFFDWYAPKEIKVEPITWMETIKKLQQIIPKEQKVGIVVDSELGNLEGYNNRTIPLYNEWFLPENYTLIYATADSSDEWCNKIIKECDKAATQRLDEVLKNPKFTDSPEGMCAPIGLITLLDPDAKQLINSVSQHNKTNR